MVDFFECMQKYMISNKELAREIKDRVYPQMLPQSSKFPSIVYTPISVTYDKNLGNESGFVRRIVQFTVHNITFGKARNTSRILRQMFKDFSGDMYGLQVQAVHFINEMSGSNGTQTQFNADKYTNILELEFQYME